MIMFSDGRVIQSLDRFQPQGYKNILMLHLFRFEPFSVRSCVPPHVSRRLFPTITWRRFTFLCQPANVNPFSIYSGSEGRSRSPRWSPRGACVALGRTGSVRPSLCHLVCVCMHTQLSLSLTCHPISQLWPHISVAMEQAWQPVKSLAKL